MDEPDASTADPAADPSDFDHEELRVFWDVARVHGKFNAAPTYFGPTTLESVPPPAWSFGETPAESHDFVESVLAEQGGSVTAPLADYGADLPEPGILSILCDQAGKPRALLEVSDVSVTDDTVTESFRVIYAD